MIRTGLIGRDILASRSPWLHEQEAAAQGLALTYEVFDFTARGWTDAALPRLLEDLDAQGFAGVNVTYPFKQAIMPHLQAIDPSAARVGAVNTVSFARGRRHGYNTDVTGFALSLRTGLPEALLGHVVQAGAGGAGGAVAHALLDCGVDQLTIFDLDPRRAAALVAQLETVHGHGRTQVATDVDAALRSADGFVNATPLGMAKAPAPAIDTGLLNRRHWVADIVYFPLETRLLADARAIGCRVLDGSGMVIAQAAEAFAIFTGAQADMARMRRSFDQ